MRQADLDITRRGPLDPSSRRISLVLLRFMSIFLVSFWLVWSMFSKFSHAPESFYETGLFSTREFLAAKPPSAPCFPLPATDFISKTTPPILLAAHQDRGGFPTVLGSKIENRAGEIWLCTLHDFWHLLGPFSPGLVLDLCGQM